MKSIILFSFVSLAICGSTKKSNCPPEGFNTIKDFDVTQYMGTWHAQAQSVTSYLPKNRNYCVQAIYDLKNKETVAIDNYSNEGEVNGKISGGNFEANIPDLKNPSKLRVGPTWLPNFFKGPYWLVYAEKDQSGVYSCIFN